MASFENLLAAHRGCLERYVKFRLNIKADAEDCLQEIYLTAYRNFSQLRQEESFKPWILSIARNKCNDYFRQKARLLEIPIDQLSEWESTDSRHGTEEAVTVRETLSLLGDKDKQILYLYFWKDLPQAEIARMLGIPQGTVKSRLYTAKQNFRKNYLSPDDSLPSVRKAGTPHAALQKKKQTTSKGDEKMKNLPTTMPEYEIKESNALPFSVKYEELAGWFLVPKIGESLSWGMYDMPSRKCSHIYDMNVTGKARVHGIEGVELIAWESPCSDKGETIERTFVAQLTDTHCRYLAVMRTEAGVRNYITFLDDDRFMQTWGFGENNCGNETNLSPKGIIQRKGSILTCPQKDYQADIVGRFELTIKGKTYDTVCLITIESYAGGVISEQFLDQKGRTVLWRRFNRNDWQAEHYGKPWTEILPENERLTLNGETYVHWYDCITDYIL